MADDTEYLHSPSPKRRRIHDPKHFDPSVSSITAISDVEHLGCPHVSSDCSTPASLFIEEVSSNACLETASSPLSDEDYQSSIGGSTYADNGHLAVQPDSYSKSTDKATADRR